jgi:hypothetical protein
MAANDPMSTTVAEDMLPFKEVLSIGGFFFGTNIVLPANSWVPEAPASVCYSVALFLCSIIN